MLSSHGSVLLLLNLYIYSQLFEDTEGILLPPSLLSSGNVVWKRVSNPVILSTLGDEVVLQECVQVLYVISTSVVFHFTESSGCRA